MTIYALSSGPGISGVAVIRVSGKDTAKVIRKLTGSDRLPAPRVATLSLALHQYTQIAACTAHLSHSPYP